MPKDNPLAYLKGHKKPVAKGGKMASVLAGMRKKGAFKKKK